MIEFRDRFCAEIGVQLIVHTNRQAIDEGASPSAWERRSAAACSKRGHCSTPSARATSTRHLAAPAATKRNRAPRSASTASATPSDSGTPRTSAQNCGACTTAASTKARASASSRSPTGRNSTSGTTSTWRTSPSCRSTSPNRAPWWCAAAPSSRWSTTCRCCLAKRPKW